MTKKYVLLLIPALALIGAGCQSNSTVNSNANIAVVRNSNNEVVENVNQTENTNTEIDTSDWKKYTNEEYGFSFEYPNDWIIKEDKDYVWVYSPMNYTLAQSEGATDVVADLNINLFTNYSDANYIEDDDILKSLNNAEKNGYIKNLVSVNSNMFYFIEHNAYFDEDQTTYYFSANQKIISVSYFDNSAKNLKQRILDTVEL